MKKGDLRKENILKCAQELFLTKGYDDTSIQDILDALVLSKGGFYHYFDSKQELLEEICRRDAEKSIAHLRSEVGARRYNPVKRLDLILSQVFLLAREEPRLNAMILKVSYLQEDVNFREHMRVFMFAELQDMLDRAIEDGMEDGSLFMRRPKHTGRLLLKLAYDVNDEMCARLAKHSDDPEEILEIVEVLDACRDAAETLIGARFGSLKLLDLEQLLRSFRLTADELNAIKEANEV